VGSTPDLTKRSCFKRSSTTLGSSKEWKPTLKEDAHGMTNSNCTVNPAFCEFNVAYVYYCDGVSMSGDLEDPVAVDGE
jgi:hypothetical protein